MQGSSCATARSVHDSNSSASYVSGWTALAAPVHMSRSACRTGTVWIASQERFSTSAGWDRTLWVCTASILDPVDERGEDLESALPQDPIGVVRGARTGAGDAQIDSRSSR